MGRGGGRGTSRRLRRPPAALATALAALALFGGFYAIGRATAGTRSGLRSAEPLALAHAAPRVPLLASVAPLPRPPAPRHAAAQKAPAAPAVAAPPPAPAPVAAPKTPRTPKAPKIVPPAVPKIVSGGATGPAGAAAANVGCSLWASPSGDDGAAGTEQAPFRTVTHLAAALRPGQNGCLAPGATFAEKVQIWNAGRPGAPIKILTGGPARATIRGSVSVSWRAHDVVLASLRVDGADPAAVAAVTIHGARVSLVRDEVTGGGYLNASKACVRIESADGALLDGDQIHNCTRVTSRTASAPGVLLLHARGAAITNSFVYHTVGAGIALGRGTTGARVEHDVVDGNVGGISVVGSRNTIADNIVSYSATWNVHGSAAASGNVVTGNCLWKGFKGQVLGPGLAVSGNLVADPRYRSRPQDLTVEPGPCFGKRPQSYTLATTNLGTPWPRLAGVSVRWTLEAHPARVVVDSLSFGRLAPGATYLVRCLRGCAGSERLLSAGGVAESAFDGRSLPRGAVLEVRERRDGWVGAYARISVVGGKRGLSVSYACLPPEGSQTPVPCSRYGAAS